MTDNRGYHWRKSSYSANPSNACVEVATRADDVAVRDSKNTPGPMLTFTPNYWQIFVRTCPSLNPTLDEIRPIAS
jgi:hypothetical protein